MSSNISNDVGTSRATSSSVLFCKFNLCSTVIFTDLVRCCITVLLEHEPNVINRENASSRLDVFRTGCCVNGSSGLIRQRGIHPHLSSSGWLSINSAHLTIGPNAGSAS